MRSVVHFADKRLKEAYNKLKDSKVEDRMLHKWISRAIDDLEINAFCGIQIPKKFIPKVYIDKYQIDNLWKYSAKGVEIIVLSCKWRNPYRFYNY